MAKVLLALISHQPMLLDGLESLLARSTEFIVTAKSRQCGELASIASTNPDLVIIDPGHSREAFQAIQSVTKRERGPKVLVFATEANVDYAMKALENGASGFLATTAPAEEILEAIHRVLSGDTFVNAALATRLVSAMRQASARKSAPNPIRLSVREQQIVDQLKRGRTNKEIARALEISEKTVKHYMTLLMQKVHAKNRLEVAMRFNGELAGEETQFPMRRRATDLL